MSCTIGIASVNGPERIDSCLRSIFNASHTRLKFHNTTILVVDDGSDPELLEENKSVCAKWGVTMLMHGARWGVPKAWNTLTKHKEDADYVVLLNDDVLVTKDWLDVIIYSLENNPFIGVIGFNAYEGSHVEPAQIPCYVESRFMFGSSGTPLLSCKGFGFGFRMKDWVDVGGFDERYFCFFEEVDFCLSMISKLNKRPAILTYPILHHIGAQTTTSILDDPHAILSESKRLFEEKWDIKWEELRTLFSYSNIPPVPEILYQWDSNVKSWQ